jgi:hypothetical protein
VTFRFYKDKASTIFSSNKYINEMSYVTAELVGQKTFFNNAYDPYLEPFIAKITDVSRLKPVWYGEYTNGVATLKLYETGNHAIRLIDGEIFFPSEYSVPNITDSYGINIYAGIFNLNGTSNSYGIYLSSKDINPYNWLFSWILIIAICFSIFLSLFLLFMIPDYPFISLFIGIGLPIVLLIVRVVLFIFID